MSAQFLGAKPDTIDEGLGMMGKPISFAARQVGFDHCIAMGLKSKMAMPCVQEVSGQLERDKPYEAMAAGMKYLDLTGTYRLFAVLLCASADEAKKSRKRRIQS